MSVPESSWPILCVLVGVWYISGVQTFHPDSATFKINCNNYENEFQTQERSFETVIYCGGVEGEQINVEYYLHHENVCKLVNFGLVSIITTFISLSKKKYLSAFLGVILVLWSVAFYIFGEIKIVSKVKIDQSVTRGFEFYYVLVWDTFGLIFAYIFKLLKVKAKKEPNGDENLGENV